MNDDTAQEIVVVLKRMVEELTNLNDNVHYVANQINSKYRDNNIELVLREISTHLEPKINNGLNCTQLCHCRCSNFNSVKSFKYKGKLIK